MSAVRLLPWKLHTAIEYLAGIFLILSGFIFGFTDESAFPVFVGIGIVVLAGAVLTDSDIAVVRLLPPTVHGALDYLIALVLLTAPWIFGFREVEAASTISIILGVAHLVITLVTRFPEPASSTTHAS